MTFELVSADVTPLYSFVPFGQVTQGTLRVKGKLSPVRKSAALLDPHRPRNWKQFRLAPDRAAIFEAAETLRSEQAIKLSAAVILDASSDTDALRDCVCFEGFGAQRDSHSLLGHMPDDSADNDGGDPDELSNESRPISEHLGHTLIARKIAPSDDGSPLESNRGGGGGGGGGDGFEDSSEDEFEPKTYSVGLLLSRTTTKRNTFRRVGVYKIQDVHDEYYAINDDGFALRPSFEEWTRGFTILQSEFI